jgi:surface antigen
MEQMSRITIVERLCVVLLALVFASCASLSQTAEENPKAILGGMGGGAAGGLIAAAAGASPGWIAFSVLAGGLLGGAIGNRLDDRDKEMAAKAAQQAFENNQAGTPSTWQNPDSGASGTITPTRTYQIENGQYCREYTQEIRVGGEKHESYGTACRQPDGSWKVVN